MDQKINSQTFSFSNLDLYQFNMTVRSWNLDFLQLNTGRFSANLKQYISEDFQLGYGKFNKVIKQEGFSPEGVWSFTFVNDVKLYWRNYRVQPKSVIIYSPGSEINAVSDPGFEVMTFSISEKYLLDIIKKLKMENIFSLLRSNGVLATNNPLWDTLRESILVEINRQEQKLDSKNKILFRESFTKKLLILLKDATINTDKVSGKKRLKLIHDAEHYILKRITEPITVSKIAFYLKVSERTLLYAFKNRFAMGPKAYMLILKLNQIHNRLNEENTIRTIAPIARDSGFWHMGQFYKDYKEFFGELPSVTLRNNLAKKI